VKTLKNKLGAAALVFLAAFLAHANSITPSFHWEDETIVSENVHIRTLKNIPHFFRPGYVNVYESGQGNRYRPLRTVTLALDYAFWKSDPRGYHLTNVLLHAAVAALVWLLCLLVSGSPFAALAAGLLFALHPVHVESIAWVKNRSDILCSLFYLSALSAFAAFLGARSRAVYALSLLLLPFAFLAKEMALTFPFAAALLLLFVNKREGERLARGWQWLVPYFALLAGYLLFREKAMIGGADYPGGPAAHLLFILNTAGEYLRILVWPAFLSIERQVPTGAGAALAALAAAAAVPALYRLRGREGAFWLLLFFFLCVPVLNLEYIPGRPLAEQRMYLPSAAFCAFAAWALAAAREKGGRAALAAGALLAVMALALGARSVMRNRDWASEALLWEKTAAASPTPRVYNNLAVVLSAQKRHTEAYENALEAIKLDPSYVDAYNTLGAVCYDLGLYDRSIGYFEKALFYSDGKAYKSLINLAALYALKGRRDEALAAYREALRMAPWVDAAHYNLGLLLASLGRGDEALAHFREAAALNPYNARTLRMTARLLSGRGDVGGAGQAYRALLRLEPADMEAAAYLAKVDKSTPAGP